ncbi:tyrosine-type recombinase/integrase [Flavobacterium sp.]|uniref:tyrosine-type recombinase/integrase n=1 Tax=Flavobacterium sp. TaxID=239 RepID=UPI004034CC8B
MQNFQILTSRAKAREFVDYIPAELRINQDWLIVFYAKNPVTGKLERERRRVPKLKNLKERRKVAKKMEAEINRKLEEGWHPALEQNGQNSFRPFRECVDKFLDYTQRDVKKQVKSEDTFRTYKSFLNMIATYMEEKKITLTFALEFNKSFIVDYLDWIYYDRENSPRTYNNHLNFIITFCTFLIEKSYLKENPTNELTTKATSGKKREPIPKWVKEIIRDKLPEFNWSFFVLCMCSYYGLVRRTELTKLKVRDFDLDRGIITIPCGEGKYKSKTEFATIPENLLPMLIVQLREANINDYAFSKTDLVPGVLKLAPKKISDLWAIFRKKYDLPANIQWYDLKRTGITDLFLLNIPALVIRDQARHKDLKTTELYTPYIKPGNEQIKKSGASF